jgi:hypothetical protein
MKVNNAVANSFATAVLAALDAGSGPSVIKFYTGAQPAGPNTAITSQTLLGTLTCSDPSGTISGRVLTLSTVTEDSSADATGTCTWARHEDSDGNAVADYSVTATGGGGDIELNTVNIVTGGPIQITGGTITF